MKGTKKRIENEPMIARFDRDRIIRTAQAVGWNLDDVEANTLRVYHQAVDLAELERQENEYLRVRAFRRACKENVNKRKKTVKYRRLGKELK